jgi:hypothetical protein
LTGPGRSLCAVEKTPKNNVAQSNSYDPQISAKSIGSPRTRLGVGKGIQVPPVVREAILRAEIGEAGVVRNLKDRPPRRLLNKLDASVSDLSIPAFLKR